MEEETRALGFAQQKTEAAGSDRWNAAVSNLSQMNNEFESLRKLLIQNSVYLDEESFGQAAANAQHGRKCIAQERRIRTLERELDAAVKAARQARDEKKLAESAQRAAEEHCQQVLQELENTTKVFKLHMEELRAKQEEIAKKDSEIQVLKAIIETLRIKTVR